MSAPFSMQELSQAGTGDLAAIQTLRASDDIALAYRAYLPAEPTAVVVFYHGGGAHSGAGYAHLAAGLRDGPEVAVYTPDIRGHGESAGERGDATPFAVARIAPFIINAITAGLLMGHRRAVKFNYPPEALTADPRIVASNTVNLANAITPSAPHAQFAGLSVPFGLWVGADDEIFDPDKVVEFGHSNARVRDESVSIVVPDRNHLGILVSAHEFIGPWLAQRIAAIH
jgi:acylglycerol lipase